MKTQKIVSLILAIALVFSVGCVSAFAEEATVSTALVFAEDAEHKLSGYFAADGYDGAIQATNGATLTISGTDADTVKGLYFDTHEKGYTMAVWAEGKGTKVEINGGYYTNDPDPKKEDQADLIYASNGAEIEITGGKFECATPRWTLNCNNSTGGTITVKGGKFYQFDPSNAQTDRDGEIVVPTGYTVVKNGDWYEVKKVVEGKKASIAYDSTSAVKGDEGALRFVFKVTLTEAADTYFGAYLLPLDIFKASGVTKAVQVQYVATEVKNDETFSADLVKIPTGAFDKVIYAIPYIKTANGVETFKGASDSVESAPKAQ